MPAHPSGQGPDSCPFVSSTMQWQQNVVYSQTHQVNQVQVIRYSRRNAVIFQHP